MVEMLNSIKNYSFGSECSKNESKPNLVLDNRLKFNESFEQLNSSNYSDEGIKSEPSNDFIPFSNYKINEDPNPQIIRKKPNKGIAYKQEIAIKYLRPPTPPTPGNIIIMEGKPLIPSPAPPIIIRQVPPRPETPTPLIIREAPPKTPDSVKSKIVMLPNRVLSPPPRKLILERLPSIPNKPQSIIIEKWLPYKQKRRVIYLKYHDSKTNFEDHKVKNLIIQWDAPEISIQREIKELEVTIVNPNEYIEKYGPSLKSSNEIPHIVKDLNLETYLKNNILLNDDKYELIGDVHALNLLSKEIREGLLDSTTKKIIERDPDDKKLKEKSFTSDELKTKTLKINKILKNALNEPIIYEFKNETNIEEFEDKFEIRF